MSLKIVFGGPPHSGKSCLRDGVLDAVRRRGSYIYFITANPDGEGAWFNKAYASNPRKPEQYKQRYKSEWSEHFDQRVRKYCDDVRLCEEPLTGIDVGGRTTPDNYEICRHASHAVLLAGDDTDDGGDGDQTWTERLEPWREMCQACELVVLAELYSDYHGQADRLHGINDLGVLRGSVHHLERGEDLSDRTTIDALADYLVRLRARDDARPPNK